MTSLNSVVSLSSLTKRFGPVTLLENVTLAAEPGEVIAIYGRSGSGKTTLLNLIAGLEPPSGGTVHVCGDDIAKLSEAKLDKLRRTRMSLIFQSYGLISALSAWDNVEFALRLAELPRAEWADRTEAALAAVGLTKRARHRPAELSGGERQRVAIARALVTEPALVLADEPTGALDHATGLQIIDVLMRFARETGANIWLVTHDDTIRSYVDRTYSIVDGQLFAE